MTPHMGARVTAHLRTDSCPASAQRHRIVNRAADLRVLILGGK